MKDDFIPGDSKALMLVPGTRVMIFQEEGIWLAFAVDAVHCVQGETIEELKDHWLAIGEAYKHLHSESVTENQKEWWEPPKPVEYESVWQSGAPHEFTPESDARMVDYEAFRKADDDYGVRYKSLVFDLTEGKNTSK